MQITQNQIKRAVWIIIVMLVILIILNLINKFPITIEVKENKQTWEANCNCECIEQTPKSCHNQTLNFSFNRINIFDLNYTWRDIPNLSKVDSDQQVLHSCLP